MFNFTNYKLPAGDGGDKSAEIRKKLAWTPEPEHDVSLTRVYVLYLMKNAKIIPIKDDSVNGQFIQIGIY